jgi:ABC-type Mn2+/Zn2+ transport system permease subunit
MFTELIMQRALLAAMLLGPACGLIGVFVTARRMSFFSDTVAHAALAGVAAGFMLGLPDPTIPLLVVCTLVAAAMLWLKERTELLTDTIMALLLSASVALGVVLLSLQRSRWAELDRYLFGDIVSVGWQDVAWCAVVAAVVTSSIFLNLNSLTLITANEDLAQVTGVKVRRNNYAFVLLLTVTVALSIRLLGVVLVTSLVVIPAASARNLAANLRQQLVISLLIGLLGAVGGVVLSYPLNIPSGPTVTLTLALLFIATLALSRFRRDPRAPRRQPLPQ